MKLPVNLKGLRIVLGCGLTDQIQRVDMAAICPTNALPLQVGSQLFFPLWKVLAAWWRDL